MPEPDIKNWVLTNLFNNGKLVNKRCTLSWFQNNGFLDQFGQMESVTSFLPTTAPVKQRVWHIVNNKPLVTCAHPNCSNIPEFQATTTGYLRFCSSLCAQSSPEVQEKTKRTNLAKYGFEFHTQSPTIIEKKIATTLRKFGIDAPQFVC
jgi:hypothetical protein